MGGKKNAKIFWTGRSQAVRLPKEFRFETETVSCGARARPSSSSPRMTGQKVTSSRLPACLPAFPVQRRARSRSERESGEVPARH